MNRLSRLSRLSGKFVNWMNRASKESKKEYREMMYDLRRMPKRTLKTIYGVILFTTTVTPTFTYALYNTYHLPKYKDWYGLKVSGTEIPLEDNLELLAIREWNFSHIGRQYKLMDMMSFFASNGSEPFSAGDIQTRSGAIVGLPYNFVYNSVEDVKLNELNIFGEDLENIDLESKSDLIKQLIECLVLSENAKKFAITREIHLTDNLRVLSQMCNIGVSAFLGVGIGQQIILYFNIRRLFLLSFAIRLVSLAFGLSLLYLLNEIFYYNWNLEADEETVKQGPNYYTGALEYYEKLLKRNAILYQLFGTKGKEKFTKEGEVNGFNVLTIRKRLERILEMNSN